MKEELRLDSVVICTDGSCGHLAALIIDPVKQTLTHLVVHQSHGADAAERLIPVDAVTAADDAESSWRAHGKS